MPDTEVRATHAETVRRFFDLVDDGDLRGAVALFAADGTYLRSGYAPFEGRDRVAHFYLDVRAVRSCAHSLDAVVADGHRVAVHGGFTGESFDGTRLESRFADFFEFTAAGEISRRDTYFFAPVA